jgi:hypothetical protein
MGKTILCIVTGMVFAFSGCAGMPKSTPSVYIEKTVADLIQGNFTGKEAYAWAISGDGYRYYKFISEAYLNINDYKYNGITSTYAVYDNNGNKFYAYMTDEFKRLYNLKEHSDYNPKQKYRIRYCFVTPSVGKSSANNKYRFTNWQGLVYLEAIEGFLTYQQKTSGR